MMKPIRLFIPSLTAEVEVIYINVEGPHDEIQVTDVDAYYTNLGPGIPDLITHPGHIEEISEALHQHYAELLYELHIDKESYKGEPEYYEER